ncbi:MAG: hypothetical protein WC186_05125 [Bacteroidales bacterium]
MSETIMNVDYRDLCVDDIPLLSNRETLYTFDPRSILDECLGKHRYIVSCENLLSNILQNQYIAVNQYAIKHTDPDRNRLLTADISGDPRISMYIRLKKVDIPETIKHLFVSIPHPEADRLAMEKGWSINYSYADFLDFNNKIAQKERLGDLTPTWTIIDPKTYMFDETENCYFKREIGAGGYATFHASDLTGMKLPSRKYPARWYKEIAMEGEPRSVQVFRHGPKEYTVFGYSEMKIIFRKNYAGGLMRKTANLPDFLHEEIALALERLDPIFRGYTGFMGLDFLENGKKLLILEANIRVTMATFVTLQLNSSSRPELEFYRFQ